MKRQYTIRVLAFILIQVMVINSAFLPVNAVFAEGQSVISDNSISDNSISENSLSDNSISCNNVQDNDVSDSEMPKESVSDNSMSGNSMSGNSMSGNSMSGNSMSGNSMSGNSMSGNSMSGNSMSGNSMSGNSMSGNSMSGNSMSGNSTSDNSLSDNHASDTPSGEEEKPYKTRGTEFLTDLWVDGFLQEDESLTYTGSKVTQNLKIYYKDTLLIEKEDYTLTYKNNTNAAKYDDKKAPSVTIKMKGLYSGSATLYFTILPRNIDEAGTAGYEQTVNYAKTIKIPAPEVYYGTKKLSNNKDFTCDYSGDNIEEEYKLPAEYKKGASYTSGKTYKYTVKGIKNFTGEFTMQLVVLDKKMSFASASVTLEKKSYVYAGTPLTKEDVKITKVKLSGVELENSMYTYELKDVSAAGKGTAVITPSEAGRAVGYRGVKKVKFTIKADRKLTSKNTELGEGWIAEMVFDKKRLAEEGGFFQKDSKLLVYKWTEGTGETAAEHKEALVEGRDYTITYKNAGKAGTVTLTFKGIGRYSGSIKKTYKVLPNTNLEIIWARKDENGIPCVTYQKGGVTPEFQVVEVSEDEKKTILKNKTDYTITMKNNKKAGEALCTIKGKGNYKGFKLENQPIKIEVANIGNAALTVADKQYSTKANGWKSKVTVTDVNGKKLSAGTDYVKEITYSYNGDENDEPPRAGTVVNVTVQGINNYAGSILEGRYRIFRTKISQLVVVIDTQKYTGEAITLTEKDIHVYEDKAAEKREEELPSSCYGIVKYKNNINSGNAKVTLEGFGDYGGTKDYTFKITKGVIPITSFSLNMDDIVDTEGKQVQLLPVNEVPEGGSADGLKWTSSDTGVATVDQNGLVSLKKAGITEIKVTTANGKRTRYCMVVVLGKEPEETPKEPYLTLDENFRNENDSDDTAAFRRAINSLNRTPDVEGACNTLFVPAGVYYVSAAVDSQPMISLKSNMKLIMSPNAVIKARPNDLPGCKIIYADNGSENITISGGNVIGDRKGHLGSSGEWGMGIAIHSSTNVTISDVNISDCWGDGIYLGSDIETASCVNIEVINCNLNNNRRNNMSIVAADYVNIENCRFTNANGTAPQFGIDIETNVSSNPNEHITISNSYFAGNKAAALGIITPANDIKITGCTLKGEFINYNGAGKNVSIKNSVVNGVTYP